MTIKTCLNQNNIMTIKTGLNQNNIMTIKTGLNQNNIMTIKTGLVTSLYSHDIILVLFQWIIKKDYKNKYLVTGDWGQSKHFLKDCKCV